MGFVAFTWSGAGFNETELVLEIVSGFPDYFTALRHVERVMLSKPIGWCIHLL